MLEDLVAGEHVDPYDLVTLGDLCVRGGRSADAVEYYARAVHAYRDASLLRNGIALCRKVVRTQTISDHRFLLLLGELCEQEGLVVDAVMSYVEYAETLNPEVRTESTRWLDSLARLCPKSVELLTRQAEILSRWRRTSMAVALLRSAADSTGIASDRQSLLEAADQMAARGPDPADERERSSDQPEAGSRETGEARDEPADWVGLEPGAGATARFDARELDLEIGTPGDGDAAAGSQPARAGETADDTDRFVLDMQESSDLDAPGETGAAGENERHDSPSWERSADPTSDLLSPEEERDSGTVSADDESEPAVFRSGRRRAVDHGLDADEIESLQARLRNDPFNIALVTKLLEVYDAEGDILSALDLRERLGQALEQKGDPEGALRQYQAILRVEPRHRTVRERARRLAQELGEPMGESDPTAREVGGAVDLNGMARVEIRDDVSTVDEKDMLDLNSLLTEFREGLKEGMVEASAKAHYDMGLSHMEMELFAEAAEAFEIASSDASLEPEARELWGRCLRQAGRPTEAVRVLRAALALRPESLGVRYQLALALEADGDAGEALRLHQSILREDPDFEDSRERMDALGGSDCPTPPPS